MTVIVKMVGSSVIENAFPLLNITRLDLPPPLRPTKKYKIPYCGRPGAILSAKFRDVTRGIVKSKAKRSFLNSITIDICTSKKNINAKLSGGIIQMCGPDSEGLARETAQHIIDHLLKLQTELDYINSDKQSQHDTIEWLKENTQGKDYVIDSDTQEIIEMKEGDYIQDGILMQMNGTPRYKEIERLFNCWHEGDAVTEDKIICNNGEPYILSLPKGEKQIAVLDRNFFIRTEMQNRDRLVYKYIGSDEEPLKILIKTPINVMEVKSIKVPSEYPSDYPDHIDPTITNFYIKYAPDFAYHHVYCQFLDSVKDIETVASEDLAIDSINMAMVNYSYSLGMSVDRWALANYINGMNGFTARYINATDHSVTISLPYENQEDTDSAGRRKKEGRHTFMVHKSGIVTQSGRNIPMMRRAYYLFMATLAQIRHLIIQENKPFNLKYRPVQIARPMEKIPQMVTC